MQNQVNIDPTELLIQQLKEENERLKKQYGAGGAPAPGGGAGMTEEEKEAMKKQLEEEMKAKMEEIEKMMAEMSKSWEEKLKEAQAMASAEASTSSNEAARREKEPHILNVHEDPLMSGAICYFLPLNEEINFGNRNSPGQEEILLGGVSIRPDHCRITNKDGKLDFGVREECKVLVNGQDATGKHGMELHHNDRIVIGNNYYFVVVHPGERESNVPEGGWPEVGWDMVQREIAKAQGIDVDVNWGSMTEEEKRRALLNDELVQVMPRVIEANALAKELKRDFKFDTRVMQVMHKTEGMVSLVMVQVVNEQTEMEWLWEKDKFVNRVYLMRELYEKYLDGSLDTSIFGGETDPFVDPNEAMHVGYSSVFLKSLAYCMPSEDDHAIYHDSQQTGIMHIKIEPCKPDGAVIKEDEDEGNPYDDVEEPKNLLGKRLDVLVTITSCKGLAKKFSSETYIEFDFPKAVNPNRPDGRWRSGMQTGTINPNFNFVQQITYESVDDQVLHRLEFESAFFHVFGLQENKGQGGLQKKKLLSQSEIDDLQNQYKKATADLEKNSEIFDKVRDLALSEAQTQNGIETLILGLANALADAGYDVAAMVEAAQAAGRAAPASSAGAGSSSDADKAKIAELEAKLVAAASAGPVPATPRDEKDAAIKALETKIAELEAASSSMAAAAFSPVVGGDGGDAALQKELAETKALLVSKENDYKKQIAESHEAERAAKAKLHEQNDELQSLRDGLGVKNTDTPADDQRLQTLQDQLAQLEKEKGQLKGQTAQLQGQLDLAKAEAAKANTKSGSCQVQ